MNSGVDDDNDDDAHAGPSCVTGDCRLGAEGSGTVLEQEFLHRVVLVVFTVRHHRKTVRFTRWRRVARGGRLW